MGNKLNPFEEQLKKAANNFEAPYDASAWSHLESKLDGAGGMGNSGTTKWFTAALVVVTVGISLYFYNQSSSTESTQPIATENTHTIKNKESIPVVITETNPVQENKVVSEGGNNDTKLTAGNQTIQKDRSIENVVAEVIKDTPKDDNEAESPKTQATKPIKEPIKNEAKSVPVASVITFMIETAKSTVCAGEEVIFSMSQPSNHTIVWQIDNGNSIPDDELVHIFFEEGKHVIKAWDVDAGAVSNELQLTVNPKPDASFLVTESIEEGAIPVVHFTANVTGEKYYKWILGDGYSGNGETISHTYAKSKDYEVSLQVMNKYGCNWTRYERFTNEKEFNLLAPNSFSPNGDGTNDEWFPKALASGYYEFELKIYDRNNRLVYTTKDPNGNWNGRVNGTNALAGNFYIWNTLVVDPNGIQQQYNGIILVVN